MARWPGGQVAVTVAAVAAPAFSSQEETTLIAARVAIRLRSPTGHTER